MVITDTLPPRKRSHSPVLPPPSSLLFSSSLLSVLCCAQAVEGKLDAKDWINAALECCGGKGGGKPDRAQVPPSFTPPRSSRSGPSLTPSLARWALHREV